MPADRITRTRTIDGVVTPAFIHNGSYYAINLLVYADGVVDCWGLVDLPLFREKVRQGWVVPGVPAGAHLSVHGRTSPLPPRRRASCCARRTRRCQRATGSTSGDMDTRDTEVRAILYGEPRSDL